MNKMISVFTLVILMMGIIIRSASAGLSDGLVAYYPFNGNANDESGNGNHGTEDGVTLTQDRFGNPDSAYLFDGIDDKIRINDSDSLDFGYSDYTIAAWIKTDSKYVGRIFSKGSSSCWPGYMMRTGGPPGDEGSRIWLENASGGCRIQFYGNTVINDNEWHFVAGVVDRDVGATIYVDGEFDAQQILDTTAYDFSTNRNPMIGYNDVGNYREPFDGVIDEVRLYNRALTEAEILELFNETSANTPPTIDAINGPAEPVALSDQPVSVGVAFSDPDVGDSHDVTWDWGDTNSDTQTSVSSPATQGHIYASPGVYSVGVTVTDGEDSAHGVYEFIVIYDPDGGFVTGGGWFDSPPGACSFDACTDDTTGKANFGFVSKYKKGADVPIGNTEFQFKAGNLNFHSDSYDWLVVAGHKAKYKGVGTINGTGNYGFMISAIDEKLTPSTAVDLFRIKIWDKATGEMVYDNQMDADDSADPTTAIGGGNIVIHQ